MKLKSVMFRESVQLPSGARRPSASILNTECRGFSIDLFDRFVVMADVAKKAVIFIPLENVIQFEPLDVPEEQQAENELPEAVDGKKTKKAKAA